MKKDTSGIYKITNLINNKFYIGSGKCIRKRFYAHKTELKHNKHTNSHLQRSWNKYGEENFKFEVLVTCPKEYRVKLEQWFLDNMKPEYNICMLASCPNPVIITDEYRKQISLRFKGKKQSSEWVSSRTEKRKIKIVSLNLKTNNVEFYNSQKEACLKSNISEPSIISSIKNNKIMKNKKMQFFELSYYNKLKNLK